MGPEAYRFVDFLAANKQSYWQVLPLTPTNPQHGSSPYHSTSAFAGNPFLISPDVLQQEGLVAQEEIEPLKKPATSHVDYVSAIEVKEKVLSLAIDRFRERGSVHELEQFCSEHEYWLDDLALFNVLKDQHEGAVWTQWPKALANREPDALAAAKKDLKDEIEAERIGQFLFFRQWRNLRNYSREKGIQMIGDMPIYVVHDSADLWAHPELFHLDDEMNPTVVAGVPPDYFSATGQLWGNPVYRWDVLQETSFDWWVQRASHNMGIFDIVRLDHFRGFSAYWEVPATETSAVNGRWVNAPGQQFFRHLKEELPDLSIIAEDLGTITPDVTELMNRFDLPGMKVLLFAFGGDVANSPYAPHNHVERCVVYTGTHDNNTARGWFETDATEEERQQLFRYLGHSLTVEEAHRELIRSAMMSVARRVVVPMQDVLGLGGEARMNRPATPSGNWEWRLLPQQVDPGLTPWFREMTETYGRT